ncbi:MAG: hypothetical protein NVS1B4_01420 [Gemmatimonadaceae bacterium]
MPDLLVRIKKKSDGSAALSCQRADGSVTWQRQEGGHGLFFPRHDLTHYAVETVLGVRRGFYGLVSEGWNFSDFDKPWPRGRLPAEANVAEVIVGFLDIQRATGERWDADELNAKVSEFCVDRGIPSGTPVSAVDLERIRSARRDLFARWDAVRPGGTLELAFSCGDRATDNTRSSPRSSGSV